MKYPAAQIEDEALHGKGGSPWKNDDKAAGRLPHLDEMPTGHKVGASWVGTCRPGKPGRLDY
jgi:hypothetical protein